MSEERIYSPRLAHKRDTGGRPDGQHATADTGGECYEQPLSDIHGRVHLQHGNHDREGHIAPIPKITVRARSIGYDDYKENFKDSSGYTESFTIPNEALEVFLALVIENIKTHQYDVRKETGSYKGRKQIYDSGSFITKLPEND